MANYNVDAFNFRLINNNVSLVNATYELVDVVYNSEHNNTYANIRVTSSDGSELLINGKWHMNEIAVLGDATANPTLLANLQTRADNIMASFEI